jgi:hypothetical protein
MFIEQAADSDIAAARMKLGDSNTAPTDTAADAVANALQALVVVPVVQSVIKTTPCPLGHYCPPNALASDR